MNVLGIETSCDETSAAIVSNGTTIRANIIASQVDLHARYGGVVPEIASRKHVERMLPTIQEALLSADMDFSDIDAIAVTNRPGLLGALLVGVSAAKALAFLMRKPIVPIHHLEAHVYSSFLADPGLSSVFPLLVLIVSGGHTQIVRMDGHGKYSILGKTRDDAAGEAFDKGARILGLPYPGGPNLAREADVGDATKAPFPRAAMGDNLDFSFSGVKTALKTFVERDHGVTPVQDVAAGYQASILESLVNRVRKATEETFINVVCVVGGVAANARLSTDLNKLAETAGLRVVVPSPELCTDNAAMVACAGYFRLRSNAPHALDFDTYATEPLGI